MKIFFALSVVLLQVPVKEFSKKNRFVIMSLILFIFAAFRGTGDGDYYAYLEHSQYFVSLSDLFVSSPMEIGFRALSLLKNMLRLPDQFIIIFMNVISIGLIYKFVLKYSPDPVFSMFLFLPLYFQFDMHAARTAVAIAISAHSINYIIHRNFTKYIFIILLASLFHKSALIMIPMYFIIAIDMSSISQISTVLILGFFTSIMSFNELILNILLNFKLYNLANRFNTYMISERFSYSFPIYDFRLLLLFFTYFIFLSYRKIFSKNNLGSILLKITFINIILMLILRESTSLTLRLSSYLNVYTIISIPIYLEKIKAENSRTYFTYKFMFLISYTAYFMRFLVLSSEYKFFFLK